MPTIIDALVVELGFDTEGMEGGRKKIEDAFRKTQEGARKTGNAIDQAAKQSELFLTKLRNNVLALYAVFTAGKGIKQFTADVTASDAALGRLAATMDMSAQTLANWRAAGQLMGVAAQDIDGTFQNLQSDFQNFGLTGQSSIVPWFRQLGIQISDVHGKILPLDGLILKLAAHFQGRDKAQSAAILAHMGFTPGGIQLVLSGVDAIKRLLAAGKPLADAQAADTQAAAARQLAWAKLKAHWEAVGVTILTKLTPALDWVMNTLDKIGEFFDNHPTLGMIAFGALTVAAGALSISFFLLTNNIIRGLAALAALPEALTAVTVAAGGTTVAVDTTTAAVAGLDAAAGVGLGAIAVAAGVAAAAIGILALGFYEAYQHADELRKVWNVLAPDFLHIGKYDKRETPAPGHNTGTPGWLRALTGQDAGGSGPGGGSVQDRALAALRGFEGFQGKAKWDVNAYRAGYGSDTTTDPATGKVSAVNSGTTVTKEGAEADLRRRYALTAAMAEKQIGAAAWGKLSDNAKVAILSATYNYGHVPKSLVAAAKSGNDDKIGSALKGLKGANGGVNANRRDMEAKIATSGAGAGAGGSATGKAVAKAFSTAPAPGVVSGAQGTAMAGNVANDNRAHSTVSTSETKIANLNVYSAAKDAAPMASDIRAALARDSLAQQANSGPS